MMDPTILAAALARCSRRARADRRGAEETGEEASMNPAMARGLERGLLEETLLAATTAQEAKLE